jgi:hypothetical protein
MFVVNVPPSLSDRLAGAESSFQLNVAFSDSLK